MLDQFSYKVSDLATDVRDKFGDSGSVQVSDAMLMRWINLAASELAQQTSWLQKSAATPLIAGQAAYTMDVIFAATRVRSITQAYVNGSLAQVLPWPEFTAYVTDNGTDATGTTDSTYVCGIYGDTITVYPTPQDTVAGGLVVYFDAYPDLVVQLTDDCPVPDRLFQACSDYVFAQALELDENFDASKLKLGHVEDRIKIQFAREAQNPDDVYASIADTTSEDYPI